MDAYGCLGVLQLHGADSPVNYLAVVTACISIGKIGESEVYKITGVQFLPMWAPLPPGIQTTGDERIGEV
jgi:synaptojanin